MKSVLSVYVELSKITIYNALLFLTCFPDAQHQRTCWDPPHAPTEFLWQERTDTQRHGGEYTDAIGQLEREMGNVGRWCGGDICGQIRLIIIIQHSLLITIKECGPTSFRWYMERVVVLQGGATIIKDLHALRRLTSGGGEQQVTIVHCGRYSPLVYFGTL